MLRILPPAKSLALVAFAVCGIAVSPPLLRAHAPPVYVPKSPLRVEGPAIVDSTGAKIQLRGVQFPVWDRAVAPALLRLDPRIPSAYAFRMLVQRWNVNTVRIPVPVSAAPGEDTFWQPLESTVASARAEGLVVILTAVQVPSRVPDTDTAVFWKECARRLRHDTGVIFSLLDAPDPTLIPNYDSGRRRPEDWEFWLRGGATRTGETALGMQDLVASIRETGATNLIAAPAWDDRFEFQGLEPRWFVNDPGIIYESRATYDHGIMEKDWEQNFGFLRTRVPVYAGSWKAHSGETSDPSALQTLMFQTLAWFDANAISWTAAEIAPGSLISEFELFTPSEIAGTTLLLWTTGDPLGFGSILPEYIANLAGGPAQPAVAPGELLALYGQGLGPGDASVQAAPDSVTGRLPFELAGVRVEFSGQPAPVLMADSFQVYVQVPYELQDSENASTSVQLFYRGVPSNKIRLDVTAAVPELFAQSTSLTDAQAWNEDGSPNTAARPAQPSSAVVVLLSGLGALAPPIATGAAAPEPFGGSPITAMEATVAGLPATILYCRAAAGRVGVMELALRIPESLVLNGSTSQRIPVVVRGGGRQSRSGVFIWARRP
jgi:uncharacterized protein (TIGR03437 family)